MLKITILAIILHFILNGPFNCGTGIKTLSLDQNPFTNLKPTECKDRNLCYISCAELFSNNACPTQQYGFKVENHKEYSQGCEKRNENDPLTDYLKTKAAFQGEKIFRAVTPAVNNVYKVLDSYLKDIRKKDWCRQEGEQAYEQRQNEFLTQISRKKRKITKTNNKR